MIALAYLSADVWAIVGGTLAGGLIKTILSHMIVPGPRMSFFYRADHFKEIVSFGKWISLSSSATFIGSQSDYIILGFILPAPAMGLYYLAKTLKDGIESLLERLSSTMMLPVLGEVTRNNPANITDRYYRFRLPIELIATMSGGFLFASADAIVHFLYDPRYHDAGLMLRVLSMSLLLYPFLLIRSAFTAIGEPHVVAWVSVIQAISFVAGLVIGYLIAGPIGGIAGGVLSRLIPSLVILVLAHRKHWTVLSKELRCLPASGLGLVAGQLATYLLQPYTLTDLRHLLAL
jgi:O-antigen/teichoic acid export membrane protein